jgi:hypothetical protein
VTLANWALLAEIVAAVGVIISLLYLAAQVRRSNRLARTQARQSWIQMTQGELHEMADQPSIFDAFVAESPSHDDKIRMMMWLLAALRSREFQWFQYQDGDTDEAQFRAYSGLIPVLLGTDRSRKCWATYRYLFDPGFAAFVDDMLAEAPLTDHFSSMDAW